MNNGLVNAIIAYIMWGILPLYWKLFNDVPAGEILSHRVVWSFVFMAVFVAVQRRWGDIRRIAASRSQLLSLTASGLLIAVNWLIFIWAVNNGHVVETSLGYYLNPLLNVLLAVVFLHEKPNRGQWLAIAIASAAVLIIAINYGRFPWIAISLAVSFGLYGLAKKKTIQDASVGLLSETAVVFHRARLLDLFGGHRRVYSLGAVPVDVCRVASLRRGNGLAPALFCPGSCPDVTVRTRLCTIHRADHYAVIEHICV